MLSKSYFKTILVSSLLLLIAVSISLRINGTDEEGIRILIRWTAKISAVLFSIAFASSSFHYFIKGKLTKWLLSNRPHFGLAFGVSHSYHLLFLIWLQNHIHPVFSLANKVSLLGGSIAYLFMYLMMATTFPRFKSRLNPKTWAFLHIVGGYWIWLIFFRSYFKNVVTKDQYYVLLLIVSIALILRLSKLVHQKLNH